MIPGLYIPPMRGQFYDIVPLWSSEPTVRKVYKVSIPMEKEMQFQFYQGECTSSMRYEDGRKAYTFAMEDMMPFRREPNMVDLFDAAPKLMMSSTPHWKDKSCGSIRSMRIMEALLHCPKRRRKWTN